MLYPLPRADLKAINFLGRTLRRFLRCIQDTIRKVRTLAEKQKKIRLQPLTPDPRVKSNQYYVKQIKQAIRSRAVRNVALSGDYGTGKSSIVAKFRKSIFAKMYKTKIISLLTLPEVFEVEDENEDIKARIRIKIQQEIFRQLYYGEPPSTLSASHYKRIDGLPLSAIAILTFLTIPLLSWLTNIYPAKLFNPSLEEYSVTVRVAVSLFTAIIIYRFAVHMSRMTQNIKEIGMNGVSVSLDKNSPTFERAMDEIIYFFKKTKYRLIFIEDLDRFDDPKIYEELRQLNFMINNARHIRHKVVFVYTMRDGLIEDYEIRTKIFDIIIPVIPFMTQDNTLHKIQEVFILSGFQKQSIIGISKILARHIYDMRTIKTICNTAIIMRDTIGVHSMRIEELIALASIRELYPSEYEAMRKGESALDKIYKECLKKHQNVTADMARLLRRRKNILKATLTSAGNELWGIISQELLSDPSYKFYQAQLDGKSFKEDDCLNEALWQKLACRQPLELEITYQHQQYSYPTKQQKITIDRKALDDKNGMAHELLCLLEHDALYYEEQLDNTARIDKFSLATEDMLAALNKFPVIREAISTNLIDESYHLYLSPFYEVAESLQLRNFRLACLGNHTASFNFPLSDKDVKILLDESDIIDLRSPSFLNHSIVSWMVNHQDVHRLEIIFGRDHMLPDQLFNFYGIEYLAYSEELNRNYGETVDGCILRKGSLSAYINEDEYILYITWIIARLHPLDLLACLATAQWARDDTAHETLFSVAIISLVSPSEVVFTDDNREIISSFLDYYEDTIILNGGANNLAKLRVANALPTKNISLYPEETRKSLISNLMFTINKNSASIVQASSIIQKLEKEGIGHLDIDELLDCRELGPVIQYCIERPDLCDNIKDMTTLHKLTDYIVNHNIDLAFEYITPLIGNFSDKDIIRILLTSRVDWTRYKEILQQLSEPFCNIQQGKRPLLADNELNRKLIARLKTFNVISSGPKTEKRGLRIIMKNNV